MNQLPMTSPLPSLCRRANRRFRNIFSRNPKSAYSAEHVQAAEFRFYENLLRAGMTVFDVGSNVGSTAEYFAKKITPSGVVHCFEPGAYAFNKLQEKLRSLAAASVVLNNIAVGDRVGMTEFHVYAESYSSWNSVGRRPLENYGIDINPVEVITVPITTLDSYCAENRIEHIDFLKLDLEGCELQALRGARGLFVSRRVSCCLLEFGQTTFDQGNNPKLLKSFFNTVGYSLRNLISGDPVFPGGLRADTAQYAMLLSRPLK